MLLRTHLAFTILLLIIFIPSVSNKLLFLGVVLIAGLLPDIDSGFSTVGKHKVFKIFQFFIRHRGFIHSFTFCMAVTIAIAFVFPVASLGFFLGYGFHLFLDSFTIEGIMPFWPLRKKSYWHIKTGGRIESSFFLTIVLIDIVFVVLRFII